MGASAVEINGRTEVPADGVSRTGIRQILKWLDDFRLTVSVVSYPTRRGLDDSSDLDRRMSGIRSAMKLANDLGCRVVSSQGHRLPDSENTERRQTLVSVLHDLSRHSLKAGAWLALRSRANSGHELASLLAELPEGSVGIDFDPAGLMLYGHDPVASLDQVAASVLHFRARDAVRDRDMPGGGSEVQLGRGSVDMPALLARLEEHAYNGYVTIERHDDSGNSARQCAEAMEYLDNLFG